MKKRVLILLVVLAMALSITVFAAEGRAAYGQPSLTFSGTTANCYAYCYSSDADDQLTATMTLYENGRIVAGWNARGAGEVELDKTYAATSGASYQLVLNYSVDGISQPSTSVSGTCP